MTVVTRHSCSYLAEPRDYLTLCLHSTLSPLARRCSASVLLDLGGLRWRIRWKYASAEASRIRRSHSSSLAGASAGGRSWLTTRSAEGYAKTYAVGEWTSPA